MDGKAEYSVKEILGILLAGVFLGGLIGGGMTHSVMNEPSEPTALIEVEVAGLYDSRDDTEDFTAVRTPDGQMTRIEGHPFGTNEAAIDGKRYTVRMHQLPSDFQYANRAEMMNRIEFEPPEINLAADRPQRPNRPLRTHEDVMGQLKFQRELDEHNLEIFACYDYLVHGLPDSELRSRLIASMREWQALEKSTNRRVLLETKQAVCDSMKAVIEDICMMEGKPLGEFTDALPTDWIYEGAYRNMLRLEGDLPLRDQSHDFIHAHGQYDLWKDADNEHSKRTAFRHVTDWCRGWSHRVDLAAVREAAGPEQQVTKVEE